MSLETRIEDVKKAGQFRGRKELLAYFQGKQISRAAAMAAYCFDCMGYFDNGKEDCENPECPLYPWMAYGSRKIKRQMSKLQQSILAKAREDRHKNKP